MLFLQIHENILINRNRLIVSVDLFVELFCLVHIFNTMYYSVCAVSFSA